MIKAIITAIMALTAPTLTVDMPDMQIAEAAVQEQPKAEAENTVIDNTTEESAEIPQKEDLNCQADDFYSEPQEELPTPADEFEYTQDSWQALGVYHVTHYSAEECGNAIGAGQPEGGLVEGLSIAMPEEWMLGHTVYVEYYGFFRVDDISPNEADIFHWYAADAVGEDWQMVWLVE